MDHNYVIERPVPTNPQEQKQSSIFSPLFFIEMGEEGNENLKAKIKEQTSEVVEADEDWTRLSGTCTIDVSVVGGFMFQTDAGSDCSIEVIENENLPTRILIGRDQDFAMFLVSVLRHEKWTTSGEFYLRFLRRVPVMGQPCFTCIEGWVEGSDPASLNADADSSEEPQSSTSDETGVDDSEEEQEATDSTTDDSTSPPAQIPSHIIARDAYPTPSETSESQDELTDELTDDTTDEEDRRTIGAAALRGVGASLIAPDNIPPDISPPPE